MVSTRGSENVFMAKLFGPPSQATADYCRRSIERAGTIAGDIGKRVYETSMNAWRRFNSNSAIEQARDMVADAGYRVGEDGISFLNRKEVISARPTMARYIHAMPDVYELHRNQQCSSYGGLYANRMPHIEKAEDHPDYQRVVDGLMQFKKNGSAYVSYHVDTGAGSTLKTREKMDIRRTWDVVKDMIIDEEDPTDPDGGSL